jgi:hypothetical protein
MPPKKKAGNKRLPKMKGKLRTYDVLVLSAKQASKGVTGSGGRAPVCSGCSGVLTAGEMVVVEKRPIFWIDGAPVEADTEEEGFYFDFWHPQSCFAFRPRTTVLSDDRIRVRALARRMGLEDDHPDRVWHSSAAFRARFDAEVLAHRFRGYERVGENNQTVLKNIMWNGRWVERGDRPPLGALPVAAHAGGVADHDEEEDDEDGAEDDGHDAFAEPAAAAAPVVVAAAAAAPVVPVAVTSKKPTAASRKKAAAEVETLPLAGTKRKSSAGAAAAADAAAVAAADNRTSPDEQRAGKKRRT